VGSAGTIKCKPCQVDAGKLGQFAANVAPTRINKNRIDLHVDIEHPDDDEDAGNAGSVLSEKRTETLLLGGRRQIETTYQASAPACTLRRKSEIPLVSPW